MLPTLKYENIVGHINIVLSFYIHMHIVHTHKHTHTYVYIYICICMYVYTYVYIYMSVTYIQALNDSWIGRGETKIKPTDPFRWGKQTSWRKRNWSDFSCNSLVKGLASRWVCKKMNHRKSSYKWPEVFTSRVWRQLDLDDQWTILVPL
jgi:hypothetical protein